MSKSTTASASVITLAGKTAVELREMLVQKQVTKKALVAFLREKETAHGLRYPARKLLAELTGETVEAKPEATPAPAKPEPVKAAKPAPAKPEPVKAAPAKDDLAALVKLVAELTRKVEALEASRAPAAKTNAAKARKAAAK